MNPAELQKFRRRLRSEERNLVQEIEGQIAELEEATEAAGEERSSAPEDASAEIFEHEKTLAVEGAFENMLAEVRHALHKVAVGTYGICDSCGAEIDVERLEARPQASMCIACKLRDEHAHAGHRQLLGAGSA